MVLVLDPGLGGGVEQVEGEELLALEHGQEATLDLSPEGLLLAILLGRIRQRRMVRDAEPLEALGGLGGEHGGAVVGEQCARQAALLERLAETVNQCLGGFLEVPLQVTAEPRAVIEDAEELRLLPDAAGGEDGARALVEVEMPEAVDVADLEGAGLAQREVDVVCAPPLLARAEQRAPLHEPADAAIARDEAEPGVLTGKREEVVVVELVGPARVLLVLANDGFGERGADAGLGAGVAGDLARQHDEGIACPARRIEPALDGLEGEADGLFGGRVLPGTRRERLDARLELPIVGGGGEQRPDDLKAQACPSHARRRVVVVDHGLRRRLPSAVLTRRTLRHAANPEARHLLRAANARRRLHGAPHET